MRLKDLVRRGKGPLQLDSEGQGISSNAAEADLASQRGDDEGAAAADIDPAWESPSWNNFWAEAYTSIEEDSEYSKLLLAFEKHIASGETPNDTEVPPEDGSRLQSIQQLATQKLERVSDAQLSFSIGGRCVVVREVVRKVFKLVTTYKDVINSAISSEPHAALAWAGVMVVLPLLENVFQQDEDAANGLHKIVFLLVRYRVLQEEVLSPDILDLNQSESSRRLLSHVKTKIISIYAQIYVYEIRLVLQYSRSKVHRALRNFGSADGWKQLWTDIESTSQEVDQGMQTRVSARKQVTWKAVDEIRTRAETMEALQEATLVSVQTDSQTRLLMSLPCATSAIFDSAEVLSAEATCIEGTQRGILHDIQEWAESPTAELIFWLYGMAGTGKTSVALTVANALKARENVADDNQPRSAFLGASFFFKQGDVTRNSTKSFFPTIARRLAQEFPDLKVHIADAIDSNLEIGTKGPLQQLTELIVRPLSALDEQTFLPIRLIVIVDALHECVKQEEVDELLGMLMALQDLHEIQLRVLITSRRDDHILRSFDKLPSTLFHSSMLDKISTSTGDDSMPDDITRYITYSLARVTEKHKAALDWIEQNSVVKLTKKADGLFIYAATACRFLDAYDFADEESRQERLDLIFDDEVETDAPQQKIDEIYLKVLAFPHLAKSTRSAKSRFHALIGKILGFISVFFEPVSASSLSELLSLEKQKLNDKLRQLHSVVDVPQEESSPLGLVHLSFRDFLLSEERSSELPFRVDEISMHRAVLERCLDLMSRDLRQDMCELILPARLVSDVPRDRIDRRIPRYLQYACRYWVDHLARLSDAQRSDAGLKDDGKIHTFLLDKFMFWLEAMSLMQEIPDAVLILNRLETLLSGSGNPEISTLAYDAKRFLLSHRNIIGKAPLQIYCSALLFSPMKSKTRSHFSSLVPAWITQTPKVEEHWTSQLSLLDAHTAAINSVAFSPLGDLLASGSWDGTTRVWDYVTGTELYKFVEGAEVTCVDISPDGKRLATRTIDGDLRVREFAKGGAIDLMGPSTQYQVTLVAFSPTSSNIVLSTSQDSSIRLWDIDQERELRAISVPEGQIYCAVFSRCGQFVAAACNTPKNNYIALWGVEQGDLRKTFEGHGTDITKIAISADGKALASGSEIDAKLWDVATGQERFVSRFERELAFCHTKDEILMIGVGNGVFELRRVDTIDLVGSFVVDIQLNMAIASSRDGSLIAATSNTVVQLWNTASILAKEPRPERQEDSVDAIQLLPEQDAAVVCANSRSRTTLWDANADLIKSAPGSHTLIQRSTNGQFNVLGYRDFTLQLWDWDLGRKAVEIDQLDRVIFSPDGSHVVLKSDIKTLMICGTNLEEERAWDGEFTWDDFVFSPDGQVLVWLTRPDLVFHLLNLTTNEETLARPRHFQDVRKVKFYFSPEGEIVALSQSKGTVLLEVATGAERGFLKNDHLPAYLQFHPGGHLIATEKESGKASLLFRTDSGSKVSTLNVHRLHDNHVIVGLAMSAAGILASLTSNFLDGNGSCIQIWDLETFTEVGRLSLIGGMMGLSFSMDSRYLESQNGRLPLPPLVSDQDQAVSPDETSEGLRSCLYLDKEWLCQGFHKLIHVPPTYRDVPSTVRGARLALGTLSGLVALVELDLAKTPLPI